MLQELINRSENNDTSCSGFNGRESQDMTANNVQQRDKTIQDSQKILGLAIVPILKLAEMFKKNKFDKKEAKNHVSDVITLSCNAMFETNVRRRYLLCPFVHKQFQQLCLASIPIKEKTLFHFTLLNV